MILIHIVHIIAVFWIATFICRLRIGPYVCVRLLCICRTLYRTPLKPFSLVVASIVIDSNQTQIFWICTVTMQSFAKLLQQNEGFWCTHSRVFSQICKEKCFFDVEKRWVCKVYWFSKVVRNIAKLFLTPKKQCTTNFWGILLQGFLEIARFSLRDGKFGTVNSNVIYFTSIPQEIWKKWPNSLRSTAVLHSNAYLDKSPNKMSCALALNPKYNQAKVRFTSVSSYRQTATIDLTSCWYELICLSPLWHL